MVYSRYHSNVSQYPRNSLRYVNMTEHTIRYWRLGLSSDKQLESVDYYTPPAYVTDFLSATIVFSEISRLSFPETGFDMEKPLKASGRRPLARLDQ